MHGGGELAARRSGSVLPHERNAPPKSWLRLRGHRRARHPPGSCAIGGGLQSPAAHRSAATPWPPGISCARFEAPWKHTTGEKRAWRRLRHRRPRPGSPSPVTRAWVILPLQPPSCCVSSWHVSASYSGRRHCTQTPLTQAGRESPPGGTPLCPPWRPRAQLRAGRQQPLCDPATGPECRTRASACCFSASSQVESLISCSFLAGDTGGHVHGCQRKATAAEKQAKQQSQAALRAAARRVREAWSQLRAGGLYTRGGLWGKHQGGGDGEQDLARPRLRDGTLR